MSEWVLRKFSDFIELSNGKTRPNNEGKVNVYGSNGIIGHSVQSNSPEETVVIGRVGAYCGSVYFSKERCWVTDNAIKAIAKHGFSSRYIYYLLKSCDLGRLRAGSGQPLLNQGIIGSIELDIPPIHEQKAIAHILGTLDDKIDQLRKTNSVLEDMASALFKSWFIDFDPVKAKQENRPTGLPKDLDDLFPDSFEDSALGPIPTGWRVGCVGDVCDLTKSSVNPGNFPHEVFAHYSLPAYDEGQQPKLELGASIKSNKYLVPSDAVLLSKLNPHIPRIWMPDVSTQHRPIASTEFLALCPKPGYSRELVYTLVTSQMFCQIYGTLVSGTTGSHQRVSPASVLDVAIVLPPEPIANDFFDVTKHNALRGHSNIHQLRTLTNLRDTLLPKLISGDLRVPEAEQMVAELGL